MDSETFNKLRSEILTLSKTERAELAHELVKSLDDPDDMDATDAWDQEILRRLAEINTGTANLIDRDEFRRRLQEYIGNQ